MRRLLSLLALSSNARAFAPARRHITGATRLSATRGELDALTVPQLKELLRGLHGRDAALAHHVIRLAIGAQRHAERMIGAAGGARRPLRACDSALEFAQQFSEQELYAIGV